MALRFLNVDLDLVTTTKPTALIKYFKQDGIVLGSTDTGKGVLTAFEVAGESETVAKVLAGYKQLFEKMPPAALAEWNKAKKREFCFGYDLTKRERLTELAIPPAFVAFAASVKATVTVTIYDEESEQA